MNGNVANKLRDALFGETEETDDSTDLHLTRDEFMSRMYREKDGHELLTLMTQGEWRICERLDLCNAYYDDGTAYIDVKRWNNLLMHLRIVNSVGDPEK